MSFIAGFIVGVLVALIGCAIRLAFLADAWFTTKQRGSQRPDTDSKYTYSPMIGGYCKPEIIEPDDAEKQPAIACDRYERP